MPYFIGIYSTARGNSEARFFEADDETRAQKFVDDMVCEGTGRRISLEQIILPESSPGIVDSGWQALVEHSVELRAAMDERTTFADLFAFFYLRGYQRGMARHEAHDLRPSSSLGDSARRISTGW